MNQSLEGIRVVEVGGVAAMPLVGMLMGSWGADVIHVEPPGRGDMQRTMTASGMAGFGRPHEVDYLFEHVDRNKRSIAIHMGKPEGKKVLHELIASADVFLNNLRPYEIEKFDLGYETLKALNPKLVWGNLTGYGLEGPEKNTGGYDSVAFWARSGVMELLHGAGTAPNISRPAYGDSVTALSFLSGVMTALFVRERTGVGQKVEVSLFNTAVWTLGYDVTGCLITGEEALRPERRTMANPIRNIYPTKDDRWIMLGMTNAQHYWPSFCKAIGRPELENDPRFADYDGRKENAETLTGIIDEEFGKKTLDEWRSILTENGLVWAPVNTPMEAINDEQAQVMGFFSEWDHPKWGPIRMIDNPIRMSGTQSGNRLKAPELGEHTDEIVRELGYSAEAVAKLKKDGILG